MKFNNLWDEYLKDEINKKYFIDMMLYIDNLYQKETLYPSRDDLFRVFSLDPQDIKIVILGQDPYYSEGMADGLAFSTKNKKRPASLRNIYRELESDLSISRDTNDLSSWHNEGVFLLNTVLAVKSGEPLSLNGIGFERFTDKVIKIISDKTNNVVFMLWGKKAQDKISLIDTNKHLVIKTSHPSPFSASKGFLGSKCFSKANNYLKENNIKPVNFN